MCFNLVHQIWCEKYITLFAKKLTKIGASWHRTILIFSKGVRYGAGQSLQGLQRLMGRVGARYQLAALPVRLPSSGAVVPWPTSTAWALAQRWLCLFAGHWA